MGHQPHRGVCMVEPMVMVRARLFTGMKLL